MAKKIDKEAIDSVSELGQRMRDFTLDVKVPVPSSKVFNPVEFDHRSFHLFLTRIDESGAEVCLMKVVNSDYFNVDRGFESYERHCVMAMQVGGCLPLVDVEESLRCSVVRVC